MRGYEEETVEIALAQQIALNHEKLLRNVIALAGLDAVAVRYPDQCAKFIRVWRHNAAENRVPMGQWIAEQRKELHAFWSDGGEELAYQVGMADVQRKLKKRRSHAKIQREFDKFARGAYRRDYIARAERPIQMPHPCVQCGEDVATEGRELCQSCSASRGWKKRPKF